jgi:hypothetical protein
LNDRQNVFGDDDLLIKTHGDKMSLPMAATVFIIPNVCRWLIDHIFDDRMAFNDACHDRLITELSD